MVMCDFIYLRLYCLYFFCFCYYFLFYYVFLFFFFFFQAEDGIRDVAVTGVQTCALPIYRRDRLGVGIELHAVAVATIGAKEGLAHLALAVLQPGDGALVPNPTYPIHSRSEERRVGKECRCRGWAYRQRKRETERYLHAVR